MSGDEASIRISDETGVPVKWVFGIVGASVGLVVAAAVGLIFLGGLTTRLANAEKGVQDIQIDRTALIRERAAKDIALEGRLTSMEAKLDQIISMMDVGK